MRRDARWFVGSLVQKFMGQSSGPTATAHAQNTPAARRRNPHAAPDFFEQLESRSMLTAAINVPLPDLNVNNTNTTSQTVSLANVFKDDTISGTVVEFVFLNVNTTPTKVNVELFDGVTSQTVANFLRYVLANKFDSTMIHRSMRDFVVQGGGFTTGFEPVETYAPVINEAYYSNKRGTIAMAKVGGDPNSATSQWFFNVKDNAGTAPNGLDYQNGGFTVFGRVLGNGMSTIDKINALPTYNAQGAFTDLPLANYTFPNAIQPNNVVTVQDVAIRKEVIATGSTSSNTGLVTTSFDANGNLVLNFVAGQAGEATITVLGVSADGTSIADTFTVKVGATGNKPIANPGQINIDFARSTNITEQLFALTSGALRDSLAILARPTHGQLGFDAQNQQIYYIPDPGYLGTDSFTYTVRNSAGLLSQPATVTLVNAPVVTLGGGVNDIKEVVFKDSTGKNVSIKYQSGTSMGQVRFTGTPTKLNLYGTTAVLEGTNLGVEVVGVSQATSTTSVSSTNPTVLTATASSAGATLAFMTGGIGSSNVTVNANTASGAKNVQLIVTVLSTAAPVAGNGSFSAEFNRSTNLTDQIFALTGDSDGTINKSTFRLIQLPAHGTVFFDPNTQQIVYRPAAGYSGTDTFTYTVLDDKNVTSNVGTITMTTSKEITLSSQPGGIRQLAYTDVNGARVVLSLLGAGKIKVVFSGNLTSFEEVAGVGVITGESPFVQSVVISETTSASVITVTSQGGSVSSGAVLNGVSLTSDLGTFFAPTVNIGANGFIASAGSDIKLLRIGNVLTNGDITLPGTTAGTQVIARDLFVGVDITINNAAQAVRTRSWTSGNLSALSLESFAVTKFNSASGVKVTTSTQAQAIRWVMFAGGVGATGGLSAAGDVGQLLVLGDTVAGSTFSVGKDAQKVLFNGTLSASLTIGGDVNTLKVVGNVATSTLNLVTVSSMLVTGNLVNTTVNVSKGIQNFMAARMIESSLLVAVNGVSSGDLLPTAPGQFTAQPGYIGFVGLTGSASAAGFQDSRIAGKTLINARLGYVKTSNAAEGFGVSALNYTGLVRMTVLEDNKSAFIDKPANQTAADAQFASQGINDRDFILRVVALV